MRILSYFSLLILVPLATLAQAQGTKADYERANTLGARVSGKVVRTGLKPNWFGTGGKFWYRVELGNGRHEYYRVDPAVPSKTPVFDHARMAQALTQSLGRKIEADRLPIDTLSFPAAPDAASPSLLVQVGDKTFSCDLKSYALHPETRSLGTATALSIQDAPRASRSGGEETQLTLVNRTTADVNIYWLDTDGNRVSYGTLKPGDQREQHTFAGHVWIATTADAEKRPLGAFVAQPLPDLAVIDGKTAVATPRPRQRRNARGTDGPASPNGKWRVQLRNDNVVLTEVATNVETILTQDGKPDDHYEGNPYWSPDSSHFVMLKTIPAQEHKVYLIESSPKDQVQPKVHPIDYLKPGDRIAHPRPCLFDVTAKKPIPVKDDLFPNPWEIDDLHWEADSKRFVFKYNQRGHQVMRLVGIDATTGEAKAVIDEQAKTFIDWTNKVYLNRMETTHEAIWMSERDGWNHLYLYDLATGKVKNQITKGQWVVRNVEYVDEAKRQIWFRLGGYYPQQDPYYLHYARVNFDGSGLTLLTDGDGTHTVVFSPDGNYLIDTYSRVDLPPVTELRSSDGKKILELERGDASALLASGVRYPERFVAKGRDDKTDIYGVIVRPSHFDPSHKYPVIEDIYAGPQGSFVPKAFSPANGLAAMAELGFIVVQIDGMGTNNRSKAFHDVCWKNLGDAGFPDRIKWIRAAAAKYPQMDLSRVGIYGTSAGGQNALGGMLQHGDFYKVGVADCGCHDNRMDKIWWNEQWMGWPIGPHYAEQSNVTLAPRLQGKLLLMVGEMDSNVDPSSTMQVVNALIKADRDFELLVMPGQGHGVVGSPYGKRRLQDFFVRNLLHVEPRAEPANVAN